MSLWRDARFLKSIIGSGMGFGSLSALDFDDYEFILNDLQRFASMQPGDLRHHYNAHPEDRLFSVPNPKQGSFLISRAAEKRFWKIAERGCGNLGSIGRTYDVSAVVEILKSELMKRCFANPTALNDENAHDIFESAIRELGEKQEVREHIIPCSLVAHHEPRQFTIGAVRFQLTADFLKENDSALRASDPEYFPRLGVRRK